MLATSDALNINDGIYHGCIHNILESWRVIICTFIIKVDHNSLSD